MGATNRDVTAIGSATLKKAAQACPFGDVSQNVVPPDSRTAGEDVDSRVVRHGGAEIVRPGDPVNRRQQVLVEVKPQQIPGGRAVHLGDDDLE